MTIRFVIVVIDSSVIIWLLEQFGFNQLHKKDENNKGEKGKKTEVVRVFEVDECNCISCMTKSKVLL